MRALPHYNQRDCLNMTIQVMRGALFFFWRSGAGKKAHAKRFCHGHEIA